MTTSPSHWPDSALGLALKLLAVAVVLSIAAHLIESVLPILIGLGIVALIGLAGWSLYQFRKSRW